MILQHNLEKLPKAKALPIATRENIKLQIRNLFKSDMVRRAEERGRPIYIHGWLYDLKNGRLEDLQVVNSGVSADSDDVNTTMSEEYVWVP